MLSKELFVLRMCFDETLFAIESTPDDEEWTSFLSLFGFEPITRLPCTDGKERRLLASPAVCNVRAA